MCVSGLDLSMREICMVFGRQKRSTTIFLSYCSEIWCRVPGTVAACECCADLLAYLGGQVGCTWVCNFSSSGRVILDSVPGWVHVWRRVNSLASLQITCVTEAGGDERQAGSCLSLSPAFLLAVLLNYRSSLPTAASGSTSDHRQWVPLLCILIMGLLLWGLTTNTVCMYQAALGFRDKNGEPGKKWWPSFLSLNASWGYYYYNTRRLPVF